MPIIFPMEPTYTDAHHRLARYAKALSHPARVWILQFLDQVDGCIVGDLVKVLPLAQSSVSQHLRELKAAGLIQGDIDPPRVRYCINRSNWQEAQGLFGTFWRLSDPAPETPPANEQGSVIP
jgi:ArsR family transcriptional regulator, arsenate/arsenite/antimonite-responsive transcriptional repressor